MNAMNTTWHYVIECPVCGEDVDVADLTYTEDRASTNAGFWKGECTNPKCLAAIEVEE